MKKFILAVGFILIVMGLVYGVFYRFDALQKSIYADDILYFGYFSANVFSIFGPAMILMLLMCLTETGTTAERGKKEKKSQKPGALFKTATKKDDWFERVFTPAFELGECFIFIGSIIGFVFALMYILLPLRYVVEHLIPITTGAIIGSLLLGLGILLMALIAALLLAGLAVFGLFCLSAWLFENVWHQFYNAIFPEAKSKVGMAFRWILLLGVIPLAFMPYCYELAGKPLSDAVAACFAIAATCVFCISSFSMIHCVQLQPERAAY